MTVSETLNTQTNVTVHDSAPRLSFLFISPASTAAKMSPELYTGHAYTGSLFSLTTTFSHFLPLFHRTYGRTLHGVR
jgi:hypothetical protein